ncbi:hypothetical protein H1P_6510002 [Hyella patelloides LEGE 07179]|uniref:DUF4347 domain-containing protein n=2 Tax=Hyella TaxID=945733 RepID=A0A563W2I2_9CYAN|nr:hypothetical protein H1P_6510002 [Hyella patelloides LEGE 07179]
MLQHTPLDKGGRGDRILLYGCNVAAGDAGAEFIAKLRNFTDAEIAASTTPIGNAAKGGNWELDVATDYGQSRLAFTAETQQNYIGVLTTISGNAFLDFNNDGQKRATASGDRDAEDVGISGITVTAYYSDGSTATTTTDSNGDYTLDNPSDLAARVEFTNVPQSYEATALSSAESTTVSSVFFVDDGTGTDTTANLGLFNPNFYIADGLDPTLITTCFVLGSFFNSTETAIVSVLHSASGNTPTKSAHATIGEVGAVNGLAYSEETEDLFLGAFQKRFADIGPQGNATIYRVDGTTGNVSTFINLEDFFGANIAGDYSHGNNQTQQDSIDGNIAWDADKDGFAATTKVALGDVEISEDRRLYYRKFRRE